MYRADKFYGPDRQVLANISLSFLPGAKIGVLGPNGAGKSTLLRIMAGREEPSSGVAELAPGATVGLLEQEPELDPAQGRARQRRGRRPRGRATCSTASTRSPRSSPSRTPTSTRCSPSRRRCRSRSTAATLDARRDARPRDGRAAPARRRPRRRRRSRAASAGASRSAGCCSRRPTCCSSTSRRTTSTPSRSAWLERFLAELQGHRRRRHARPVLPRQRRRLDPRARPRHAGSRSRATTPSWLEQKQARLAVEEKQESARRRTLARELEWVRMSPRARHAKSKARLGAYEKLLAEEQRVKLDRVEIHIPPGPRLGDVVDRGGRRREGLRRPAALRGA